MDWLAALYRWFRWAWTVDFEFTAPPGERPVPLCVVARELRTNQLVRLWLADGAPALPPYSIGSDTLLIAYYSSAEWGCHIALDWPIPHRVLDLYVEFRHLTSGLSVPCGRDLLGALVYHGLDGLAAAEKESMRQLAMRGGPYTDAERQNLLDYCQTDVDALAKLLPAMLPKIDLPRALLRGRFMIAAAKMEWIGVPIDTEVLTRLRTNWVRIKARLIDAVDQGYGVFVPVGQRRLDPDSRFGAAVLQEARTWNIDPYRLADAVDQVWAEEREASAETRASRRAARETTGLTPRRISSWENAGKDSSEYPGLDAIARELAGAHPALGLGAGYSAESGVDGTDYAGRLWVLLRDREEAVKPKYDQSILRRAAERVHSTPEGGVEHLGPMRFSSECWATYLVRKNIAWPRLESGSLALDDDTFREMARAYPAEVGPIRDLRHALSELRLHDLAVGTDGRNRCLLSAFGSRTGRNQPSNSRFIFGPSTWLRSLIRPGPGRAVCYLDWSQQELAIAAALSGDQKMQEAYTSGDFYLTFAKMAGAVPADATKKTHAAEREQFKVVSLGVLFGLSAFGISLKLNIPACHGRELLQMHQETFRQFWAWSDRIEMQAMLTNQLQTVFGWTVHVPLGLDPKTGRSLANPRSLRNFPMQAHGAEMMRLACGLATERGIQVCAPVHDALLVEGAADTIEDVVAETQQTMQEASELVLPGFPLRTEAKVVHYPDRYTDERGRGMWETVSRILVELEETDLKGQNAAPLWEEMAIWWGGTVCPRWVGQFVPPTPLLIYPLYLIEICTPPMTDFNFDPELFRLRAQKHPTVTAEAKLPRPQRGEAFIGGPIPMSWAERAVRLPGKAWHVASALWFVGIRSRSKSATVRLAPKTLLRFGLNRKTVYRALRPLEHAGLVRVERHTGKRLTVTILPAPRGEP
jgi:hypothetical protein